MNVLAVLLATMMTSMMTVSAIHNELEYCEFSAEKPIIKDCVLSDYDGNKFKLYELENGYAIYSLSDEQEVFIEGSYEAQSPYYDFYDKELYYLGPGNYLYESDGKTFDILNQSEVVADLQNASYQLSESIEPYSSSSTPNPTETETDTNGFTVINRADYFKNLTYFPQNWFGECGLIALSNILSYYDTFYNDNFIPNNKTYDERHYKKVTRSGDSGYELDHTTNTTLIRKSTTAYKNTTNYDYKNWSTMPGTNYAMRDYLFDNYMHTFWGIGADSSGYPMMDGELKSTFNDYIEANAPSLQNTYEVKSGHLFYTHARPKEYINEGLPTCLVLQSYDSTAGSGKAHVVVAYGHNDGKFLAHFGWWPTYKTYTSVVINSATIYGYFTIKYNGEHVHSRNVTMSSSGITYGICGCGNVSVI